MTNASIGNAPYPDEPQAPQRGQTRAELGRDISEAQAEAEAQTSGWKRGLHMLSPKVVWSMADGYPEVIKQFLQFCLILVYPGWVFGIAFGLVVYGVMYGLFYVTVYPVLWLIFWPVRRYQKKHHPEEYAESQRKK